MAVVKGQYDPVKAIEGMFNGSVTRIAQALRDPADYSGNTKTVLAECAKRFHDALDDCEIHLLDAKWYLEHQLRTNRSRREAQSRESGTAVKRKHEEVKDITESPSEGQSAAKKPKIEPVVEQSKPKDQSIAKESAMEAKSDPSNSNAIQSNTPKLEQPAETEDLPTIQKPAPTQSTQNAQPHPSTETPGAQPQADAPPPPTDDFAKPTPQATPTGTNDDFTFESMFGAATNDTGGAPSNKDLEDIDFDFTTGDFGTDNLVNSTDNQDPPSLDMLLPGLESYAKQTDDNNMLATANSATNTNTMNNVSTSNNQDLDPLPTFSNDFDLPNLGGPNIFDDFLNDDSLGGADGGAGGNFDDNIDLSDAALLDMDFDSFQ